MPERSCREQRRARPTALFNVDGGANRRVYEASQRAVFVVMQDPRSGGLPPAGTPANLAVASEADIVTHVALHGAYHRGQIAWVLRHGAGEPVSTDFITMVREG